ncbi:anti-sigma regulatory factor (Ser/Thr protein kinase) [Allocatelliglobosispora scoriae]|uniref:Anti-sigma regulatory factor (Ser/Thr protein kinase) n=1 Tax=Allocatelliglobosispora scoriae TaxID=643052 RepID=A0A841BIY9_9ACTN|nr:ATP-binding protein [Allocatelliglobosispora scoriae]MBB5866742.1 anti-sigma regulatory factor (Ser/Thr protein kinase) [Allocatelliglobosispora scoriae]
MTSGDRRAAQDAPRPAPDTVLACGFDVSDLYSLRAAVGAHAAAHGMGGDQLSKLLVVVTELAANAIRHGGGQGRVRLWRDGDALQCEVTDDGPGISDPASAGSQPVPINSAGGRGLWIVRQFSDRVDITVRHPGTTVTAVLHLAHPA